MMKDPELQSAQANPLPEQGSGDRAHHLRGRGAHPPGDLGRSGHLGLGRCRFVFCPRVFLRVPLWGRVFVHNSLALAVHVFRPGLAAKVYRWGSNSSRSARH